MSTILQKEWWEDLGHRRGVEEDVAKEAWELDRLRN